MKTLNRSIVRELSEAFLKALQPLESTYGIKINYRGGRFTESNVTFKIEAAVVGISGEILNKEREDFKICARQFNLNAEWLDQEFSWCGNTYKIDGLKTRCWKSPVLVTRIRDNKKFKMAERMVADAFKLKEFNKV